MLLDRVVVLRCGFSRFRKDHVLEVRARLEVSLTGVFLLDLFDSFRGGGGKSSSEYVTADLSSRWRNRVIYDLLWVYITWKIWRWILVFSKKNQVGTFPEKVRNDPYFSDYFLSPHHVVWRIMLSDVPGSYPWKFHAVVIHLLTTSFFFFPFATALLTSYRDRRCADLAFCCEWSFWSLDRRSRE